MTSSSNLVVERPISKAQLDDYRKRFRELLERHQLGTLCSKILEASAGNPIAINEKDRRWRGFKQTVKKLKPNGFKHFVKRTIRENTVNRVSN